MSSSDPGLFPEVNGGLKARYNTGAISGRRRRERQRACPEYAENEDYLDMTKWSRTERTNLRVFQSSHSLLEQSHAQRSGGKERRFPTTFQLLMV